MRLLLIEDDDDLRDTAGSAYQGLETGYRAQEIPLKYCGEY
jgi:hypothetical protein